MGNKKDMNDISDIFMNVNFKDLKPLKPIDLEKVRRNNMEADKMFEELGYKKYFYTNEKLDYIIYSKDNRYSIEFHKNNKKMLISHLITIEELQAINKKCEELEWI